MAEPDRPVAVTGAAGFIGGRVVEAFHLGVGAGGRRPVRALLRRWAGAARVARLGADMRVADVLDRRALADAFAGAGAVVHCAVGGRATIVDGTRHVVMACRDAGVRRLVHLSSAEVYGDAGGEIDEAHPVAPVNPYGAAKAAAERECLGAAGRDLEVVVLRPSIVYGPFSLWWTERFADRLASRRWGVFAGFGEGWCNLVYIDDLAAAVAAALDAEGAAGEVFHVNGPDRVTWNRYAEEFNRELGLPPLPRIGRARARLEAALWAPVRAAAGFGMRHFERRVFAVYERVEASRGPIRAVERSLRRVASGEELALYSRTARYRAEKAASVLGIRPRFDLARGLRLSAAWWRHECGGPG